MKKLIGIIAALNIGALSIGIVTPPEAVIRVGSIIKPWVVGKCIVFDDSFEHEVWNKAILHE